MNKLSIFIGVVFIAVACSTEEFAQERILEKYLDGSTKTIKIFENESDTLNYILKEFYANGQLKKTGPIKDSIVNGIWFYYYENGQLEMTGEYETDDSLNEGNFTYTYKMPIYNRDGSIKKEQEGYMCSVAWRERESKNLHVCKTGKWQFYHKNSQLKCNIDFVKGWPNNYITEYYSSGITKIEGKSGAGNRIGEWKEYYESGQIMSRKIYYSDSMRIEDFWLKNGEMVMVSGTGYSVTVDTAKYGDSIITEYVNYQQNGRNFTYRRTMEDYSKFHIWYEEYYKDGKLTGIEKIYNNYGLTDEERVSRITPYKEGLCHGVSITLFDLDTISVARYINGKEHGEHISRQMNTLKLDVISRWKMGKRHGAREFYDYEGKPKSYDFWYNDDFIGEIEFKEGIQVSERVVEGYEKEFKELLKQTKHNKK